MNYINENFSREDWCSYPKKCRVDQLLTRSARHQACMICQYMKPISVPRFLDKAHKKRKREQKELDKQF